MHRTFYLIYFIRFFFLLSSVVFWVNSVELTLSFCARPLKIFHIRKMTSPNENVPLCNLNKYCIWELLKIKFFSFQIPVRKQPSNIFSFLSAKKLFTPGPLGVSPAVRAALGRDVGSRDPEFIQIVQSVQEKIVEIAGKFSIELDFALWLTGHCEWSGLPELTHCCVLMPGSGTFSVEATLQTTSDRNKKVKL